jgi:hypothetical protein
MDAFAELGLPHSPALSREDIDARFDQRSRQRHPDAGGTTPDFTRLTQARFLLGSTARRLRHLLELEFPDEKLEGALPSQCIDLFARIGPALQNGAAVRNKQRAVSSSLARALIAEEILAAREELESLAGLIDQRLTQLEAELSSWDHSAKSLAAWAREAAFLEKWQAQVRAMLFELR